MLRGIEVKLIIRIREHSGVVLQGRGLVEKIPFHFLVPPFDFEKLLAWPLDEGPKVLFSYGTIVI